MIPHLSHTKVTFRALADAIIPLTPRLAIKMGPVQYFGAAALGIEEYIIMELDHVLTDVSLSVPTAAMLDMATAQLVASGQSVYGFVASPVSLRMDLFAALPPHQRLEAISLLEKLEIDLGSLPAPFTNNAGFVKLMADILVRLPMFGYYSEWSGYGTTRLKNPDYQILEFFPLSWIQVGYPGPSYGYRDLRLCVEKK